MLSRTPWIEYNISRATFYLSVPALKFWQKQEIARAKKEKRPPTIIMYVYSGRGRNVIDWDVEKTREVMTILRLG